MKTNNTITAPAVILMRCSYVEYIDHSKQRDVLMLSMGSGMLFEYPFIEKDIKDKCRFYCDVISEAQVSFMNEVDIVPREITEAFMQWFVAQDLETAERFSELYIGFVNALY